METAFRVDHYLINSVNCFSFFLPYCEAKPIQLLKHFYILINDKSFKVNIQMCKMSRPTLYSHLGFFFQDYEEDEDDEDDDEDDTGMGDEGEDSNEGTGSADGNDGYEADDAEVTGQSCDCFLKSCAQKACCFPVIEKSLCHQDNKSLYTVGVLFVWLAWFGFPLVCLLVIIWCGFLFKLFI